MQKNACSLPCPTRFYGLHCDQLRALEWKKVVGNEIMGTLAEAVTAGYVPLFEDLGGGKAQLVHLSYQELFVGEFMARALTNAFHDEKLFECVVHPSLATHAIWTVFTFDVVLIGCFLLLLAFH